MNSPFYLLGLMVLLLGGTPGGCFADAAAEFEAARFLELGENRPQAALKAYEQIIQNHGASEDEAVQRLIVRCRRRMKRIQECQLSDSVSGKEGKHSLWKQVQGQLAEAEALVAQENYAAALERYQQIQVLSVDKKAGMSWARRALALKAWFDLRTVYPPALEALQELREKLGRILEAGEGNCARFADVIYINELMGENKKSLALFRVLDRERPQLARQCWPKIYRLVIEARDMELVGKYMECPLGQFVEVEKHYGRRRRACEGGGRMEQAADTAVAQRMDDWFVEDARRLIYVALATEREALARGIQRAARKSLDDPRFEHMLDEVRNELVQETGGSESEGQGRP